MRGGSPAYKQIDDEKKQTKQITRGDIFLKGAAPCQEEPQAGPAEEAIVIGTASSTGLTAPEDLPWGQDAEVADSDTILMS